MFNSSQSKEIEEKSWSPNCIKVSYDKADDHDEEETEDEEGTDSYESEDCTEDDNESVNDNDIEKEVDYDDAPTTLYLHLEDRLWDKAVLRLQENKRGVTEARTWIFRRDDTNAGSSNTVRWRILPIHASCIFRAPLALIEALIEAFPQGLEKPDDQDMLPLHLACRNGASKLVVSKIVDAYPKAVFGKDRKGRTPLDLAEASASLHKNEVVEVLRLWMQKLDSSNTITPIKVKAEGGEVRSSQTTAPIISPIRPSDVTTPSRVLDITPSTDKVPPSHDDRTVLFHCILKKDWPGVIQRCQTHPNEATSYITTKGLHGQLNFLPLHKICVLQPPVDAVKAVIAAFPNGAQSQDQDGWLPLHCACYYGAAHEVIESLLTAYAKGALTRDLEGGRIPMHYACIKHASVDTLQLLIRANPKSLLQRDDDGRLPIHYCCSKGAPPDIVDLLLATSPKSASKKDDQGRLPLHLACRKYMSDKTVRLLISAFPEAAKTRDDDNKLPIHYVCKYTIDLASKFSAGTHALDEITMDEAYLVIQQLLEVNPSSAMSDDGNKVNPLMEMRNALSDLTADGATVQNNRLTMIVSLLEKYASKDIPTPSNDEKNAGYPAHDGIVDIKANVVSLEKRVLELETLVHDLSVFCKELRKPAINVE